MRADPAGATSRGKHDAPRTPNAPTQPRRHAEGEPRLRARGTPLNGSGRLRTQRTQTQEHKPSPRPHARPDATTQNRAERGPTCKPKQ
eukprot:3264855-Prymnesium_polylepis.1